MNGRTFCFVLVVFGMSLQTTRAIADSASTDDVVLKAMKDELPRAMKLKIQRVKAPYYVGYDVRDTKTLSIQASLGAVLMSDVDRSRSLAISLRVGSRSFDNTNYGSSRLRTWRLVIDDDYDALRWSIWLASDDAYKEAAESFAKKRAALGGIRRSSDLADFSNESPKGTLGRRTEEEFDRARWETLAKRVSGIFLNHPAIHESSVSVSIQTSIHRFVSTDGTVSREQRTQASLHITAKTQASDGTSLKHFASFVASDPTGLPDETKLFVAAARVASELSVLRDAPKVDGYTGPVLFEGVAAAQVIQSSLLNHLVGTPPPKSNRASYSRPRSDTGFAGKIGRRVAATNIQVVDDPLSKSLNGHALTGGFAFDAQGVPAQRVSLIKDGKLETFLMSRSPRAGIDKSNGHARGGNYSPVRAQIGNLIVTAKRGRTTKQLEKQLLKEASIEGFDFGLVVTLLDDPSVSGMDRESNMALFMASRSGEPAPPPPVLMYKLTRDGKRELVRGGMLAAIRLRAWRDVVAGKNSSVHNFDVSTEDGPYSRAGDPASIVAPDLLFPEVDVKAVERGRRGTPPVPSPLLSQ